MFVRWQKRMKRNGVTRLNAVICESRRVDGKPRQEYIAYLAGIDGVWLDQPRDDPDANLKRHEFWEKVEKRLAPLANRFGPDDHHKIREQLNAKVPMADPTEAPLSSLIAWSRISFVSPNAKSIPWGIAAKRHCAGGACSAAKSPMSGNSDKIAPGP